MPVVKIASLVLDFNFYPRPQIDSHHLAVMVGAEKVGAEFPPILADRDSRKVVDGFHRVRKQKVVYGDDADINCTFKKYRSEGDMLLDVADINAKHGLPLTSYDKTRVVLLAAQHKISDEKLASVLNMSPGRIDMIRQLKTARVGNGRTQTVPIKRTIRHKAGKRLTPDQLAVNDRLSGMEQVFYVNQLIMLIESELLDTENEVLMDRLAHLKGILP